MSVRPGLRLSAFCRTFSTASQSTSAGRRCSSLTSTMSRSRRPPFSQGLPFDPEAGRCSPGGRTSGSGKGCSQRLSARQRGRDLPGRRSCRYRLERQCKLIGFHRLYGSGSREAPEYLRACRLQQGCQGAVRRLSVRIGQNLLSLGRSELLPGRVRKQRRQNGGARQLLDQHGQQ